jgi:hypothetical protein
MATSRIVINDWLAWGNLIKTWATGQSYFRDGKIYPKPATLNELKDQLAQTGAGSVPDWVKSFELVEWSEEKLVIELPPRKMVLEAEARLEPGAPYPLPSFYQDIFGDIRAFGDMDQYKAFHAMRIGEYTVNTCG